MSTRTDTTVETHDFRSQQLITLLNRRRRQRGVTLIEVLIVIAIMALIAGGVGFVVFPKIQQARVDTAKNDCREIRKITEQYMALNVGVECPTVEILIDEKELQHEGGGADPWGTQYEITCNGDEFSVVSAGPDAQMGTEDDVFAGFVGEG